MTNNPRDIKNMPEWEKDIRGHWLENNFADVERVISAIRNVILSQSRQRAETKEETNIDKLGVPEHRRIYGLGKRDMLEELLEKIENRIKEINLDYPDNPEGRQARYENSCRVAELNDIKNLIKEL